MAIAGESNRTDGKEKMTSVPFRCVKLGCFQSNSVDVNEIKLLKTVGSGNSTTNYKSVEWTILTCPKCKETFVADPNSPYARLAPKTHIGAPNIETK